MRGAASILASVFGTIIIVGSAYSLKHQDKTALRNNDLAVGQRGAIQQSVADIMISLQKNTMRVCQNSDRYSTSSTSTPQGTNPCPYVPTNTLGLAEFYLEAPSASDHWNPSRPVSASAAMLEDGNWPMESQYYSVHPYIARMQFQTNLRTAYGESEQETTTGYYAFTIYQPQSASCSVICSDITYALKQKTNNSNLIGIYDGQTTITVFTESAHLNGTASQTGAQNFGTPVGYYHLPATISGLPGSPVLIEQLSM